MSMTLHLDEDLQNRLVGESQRIGRSPEALAKSILLNGLSVQQVGSADLTYEDMVRDYEEEIRLNAEREKSASHPVPGERFVVKPFDLGELNPRFEGLTPSEIDDILQMEEYEESLDRARHEPSGPRP
jgi:plasmid stability protein